MSDPASFVEALPAEVIGSVMDAHSINAARGILSRAAYDFQRSPASVVTPAMIEALRVARHLVAQVSEHRPQHAVWECTSCRKIQATLDDLETALAAQASAAPQADPE